MVAGLIDYMYGVVGFGIRGGIRDGDSGGLSLGLELIETGGERGEN